MFLFCFLKTVRFIRTYLFAIRGWCRSEIKFLENKKKQWNSLTMFLLSYWEWGWIVENYHYSLPTLIIIRINKVIMIIQVLPVRLLLIIMKIIMILIIIILSDITIIITILRWLRYNSNELWIDLRFTQAGVKILFCSIKYTF